MLRPGGGCRGEFLAATVHFHNLLVDQIADVHVSAGVGEYTRLGLFTVPPALVVAVLALWASVRLLGV